MTDQSNYGVGSLTPDDDEEIGRIVMPDLLDELQLDLEPSEPQPNYPCPKCERMFFNANQLGGHLSSAHRDKTTKVPCPECGVQYQKGVGLASHRSRIHGVAGTSKAARSREDARQKKEAQRLEVRKQQDAQRKREARQKTKKYRDHPLGFKVEIDTHEWNTDDIFDGVVATLWPNGAIPVKALTPLIRWREATRELIDTLQSQVS